MVRGEGRVRLALGPTGGGEGNPAWDFQFVVPDYQVDRTYTLEAALVVGRLSPEDMLARYSAWAGV